jgi:hypothetical protein
MCGRETLVECFDSPDSQYVGPAPIGLDCDSNSNQFHMALAGLHERMKNGGWRGTVAWDGSSGKGRVYLVLRAR